MRSLVAQACPHFAHTLIQREHFVVQLLQIRYFGFQAYLFPRSHHSIVVSLRRFLLERHWFAGLSRRSDARSGTCGTQHFIQSHPFHVGITGLVSCQYAHTHTEVDVRAAIIHLAVHQADTVVEGVFKIEVSIIAAFFQCGSHHFLQVRFRHAEVRHRRSYSRLFAFPT